MLQLFSCWSTYNEAVVWQLVLGWHEVNICDQRKTISYGFNGDKLAKQLSHECIHLWIHCICTRIFSLEGSVEGCEERQDPSVLFKDLHMYLRGWEGVNNICRKINHY